MSEIGQRERDNLIAGNINIVGRSITILSGQNLVSGSVLGKITASDKYVISNSGSSDGSEVPDLILPDAVDASAADTVTIGWVTGSFNANKMIFAGAHDVDNTQEGLRVKGIHLITGVVEE